MLLYIDPGTASMLLTMLFALSGVAWFGIRKAVVVLRQKLVSGKAAPSEKMKFVIFSDDKRYWQVFAPVCREFAYRGIPFFYLTMSEDDPCFDADYKCMTARYIGSGAKGFAFMNLLQADTVLATTPGLDIYQWKRSKNVKRYVFLPHGANDAVAGNHMFGLDYYDEILLSGLYQLKDLRNIEAKRNLPNKKVCFVGVPYMDVMDERKENAEKPWEDRKTILVAPTWGRTSLLYKYGPELFDALLASDYRIIVRPHPQCFTADRNLIRDLMKRYPETDRFSWNRDADNFDVLLQSDVMISDYSGIVFDFSLVFDRPVIIIDPEINVDVLDAWWMDHECWTKSAIHRIGCVIGADDIKNIADIAEQSMSDVSFSKNRMQVCRETWMYRGEGKERVVDFIVNNAGDFDGQMEDNME